MGNVLRIISVLKSVVLRAIVGFFVGLCLGYLIFKEAPKELVQVATFFCGFVGVLFTVIVGGFIAAFTRKKY